MNTKLVDDIAAAVLYEGYLLYPYRATSVKNQQRWTFGVLYPRGYCELQSGSSDTWSMQTECLLRTRLFEAQPDAVVNVRVRGLHLIGTGAMEREISLPELRLDQLTAAAFKHRAVFPPIEQQQQVEASVEVQATLLDGDVYKLRIKMSNRADFAGSRRDEALLRSLISTHSILSVRNGDFVSLLDPPEELRTAAAGCTQAGAWPVLVGEAGCRDTMLCSPIILYDYPQIAPESPGALFDGTEIDEILTLRILTLTDEEKLAMNAGDERTREILERTESMPPEQFMKLHGVLRQLRESGQETP